MVRLTFSEVEVLRKLRKYLGEFTRRYDFWFVYNGDGEATTYEGGFELPLNKKFRNQYYIERTSGMIKENWR